MPLRLSVRKQLAAFVCLAMTAGCGSSDSPTPDSGQVGGRSDAPLAARADAPVVARDAATLPDTAAEVTPAVGDTRDGGTTIPVPDTQALVEVGLDAATPRLDLAPQTTDSNRVDGPAVDGGRQNLDTTSTGVDTGADSADAATGQAEVPPDATDAATGQADVPPDSADAPFAPGPATPIIINSPNTALYNLGDGTWKIFYFDAVAGQIYVVSGLSGIAHGYLGTSPSVSPSSYQLVTDTESGTLLLTAPASQRYYLAVGVSGGGASGSFQVADGGQLLALGTTTLSLTPADAGDAYYVYRFPVTAGHGYVLNLQGPSQPNMGLSVAPRPERSSLGEFSYSIWGVGGSLPFSDEAIPAASVATSTSGFYFVNIRIIGPITFTMTVAESP